MNFEKNENLENIFECRLKELLNHGEKVNEGANAIIYRIDAKALEENVKKAFFGDEPEDFPDELAGKMLKVCSKGYGKEESSNHKKAYELIDNSDPSLAHIPKIYSYNDIDDIEDEELKDILERYSINTKHLEILLMDYIKGEDFATHIFKKIIESDSSSTAEYYRNSGILDERTDFYELHQAVAHILGYSSPTTAQKIKGNDREVLNENSAIIESYLKESDIVLDKKIFEKLTKTLQVLHENGIYHNDLHARNVMLTYNADGSVNDVVLIDFADAGATKKEVDMSIVNTYSPFSKTKEERKKEKAQKKFRRLERLRGRYLANETHKKEWLQTEEDIRNLLRKEDNALIFEMLNRKLYTDYIFANDENVCFSMLFYLAKEEKQKISEFIKEKLKEKGLQRAQSWRDLNKFIDEI